MTRNRVIYRDRDFRSLKTLPIAVEEAFIARDRIFAMFFSEYHAARGISEAGGERRIALHPFLITVVMEMGRDLELVASRDDIPCPLEEYEWRQRGQLHELLHQPFESGRLADGWWTIVEEFIRCTVDIIYMFRRGRSNSVGSGQLGVSTVPT